MNRVFVVWGREAQLSKYVAEELDAEFLQVYHKKLLGLNIPVIIRYFTQSVKTLYLLFRKKPKVVIVQNPPIFASLVCLFYCKIKKSKLMIDTHTAAFWDKKWRFFFFLFKFVAKRADLNTIHNFKNLEIMRGWGIDHSMVLTGYDPYYDKELTGEKFEGENLQESIDNAKFPVFMVNRFANDDNWEVVLKTASIMREATFYVTGELPKKDREIILRLAPKNVFFTGYLPHYEFMELMRRCRVVLAFTLRRDTLLWSIREVLALRKPFVTTDSEVMKHYFGEIGFFVKSDPDDLKRKIIMANDNYDDIVKNIEIFLEKNKQKWEERKNRVEEFLSGKKDD